MASWVYAHFTLQQRRELHQLLKKDLEYREKQIQEGLITKWRKPKKLYTYKDIGNILGKDKGSISREVWGNSVKDRNTEQIIYDPVKAHQKATQKKLYRPNCFQQRKIVESKFLRMNLAVFLPENSPEQIVGRITRYNESHITREKVSSVSHTLIYDYLYSAQGQALCKYLLTQRTKPKKWKKRTEAEKKAKKESCRILERTSIEKRPEEINDRSIPFHWEADILGSLKSVSDRIGTKVERQSRLTLLLKLGRQGEFMERNKKLIEEQISLFQIPVVISETYDNGVENKKHYELHALGVSTYFCHPYCSWEKATVENTNGRTRRWIGKKRDLSTLTQQDCNRIAHTMNLTPRKCLWWRTPYEAFFEQVMLRGGTIPDEFHPMMQWYIVISYTTFILNLFSRQLFL